MTDLSGKIIGNYRVEALLGAGGMGQVYRARHMHLSRVAAIKVMGANVAADVGFQARFRQEATAMNELRHAHIVELYDFGEQNGYFYLIMEYVPDGTLRTLLSAGHIPLAQGVDLICQAAAGMAYAHSRGIIHRDIKPGNLLLLRQGERYALKIGDFGLARMAESPDMTTIGTVIGSPQYMSPEQCLGVPLDRRTDIYSLGVVLYEVVTGYLVFQGGTDEVKRKHVYEKPPSPRSVAPDLPEEIEAIILRCLAKRPEHRFADADELRVALEQALKGKASPSTANPINAPTVVVTPSGVAPSIGVFDQNGHEVASAPLPAGILTVGRTAQCTLQLDAADISRQHLQVQWDGAAATVTDLGSSNGTFLEQARLPAHTARSWTPGQELRVGTYRLELRLPATHGADTAAEATVIQPPTAIQPHAGVIELALAIAPAELDVEPGSDAITKVTVINYSSIVDHAQLAVEGAPRDWIADLPRSIQLMPGEGREALLKFHPPRDPASRAGAHTLIVQAVSRNSPDQLAQAPLILRVGEFRQITSELRPQRRRSVGVARFELRMTNQGNAPVMLTFDARDAEDACVFEFQPAQLTAAPGQEQTTMLFVRERSATGQSRIYRLNITPRRAGDSLPLPALSAEWECTPLTLDFQIHPLEGESGQFTVTAANQGTTDVSLALVATSSDKHWDALLDAERLDIPAGQQRTARARLRQPAPSDRGGSQLTLSIVATVVDAPGFRRETTIEWRPPAPLAPSPPTPQAQSCPNCGAAVRAGQIFCSTCGIDLRGAPTPVRPAPDVSRKGQIAPDMVAHPMLTVPQPARRRIGGWFWLGLLMTDIIGHLIGAALFFGAALALANMIGDTGAYAALSVWYLFFWFCHWLLLRRRVPAPTSRAFVNALTMAVVIGIAAATAWATEDGTVTIIVLGIGLVLRLVIRTMQLRRASAE